MRVSLIKTIAALTSIAVGMTLLYALNRWPGLYFVAVGAALVSLALAWVVWFVATIDRHFEGGNRLAAKAIDSDYNGAGSHSSNDREKL